MCCRDIKKVVLTFEMPENLVTDLGHCVHLDLDTNLCKIYENRPDACRADKVHANYFQYMKINEFEDMLKFLCEELQNNHN
jgi:hypothetical protein